MTARNDLDRPATVTAALIGVLLVAISIPFLLTGEGAGGSTRTYAVSWNEGDHSAATGTQAGAGQTVTLNISIADALVSNVTLSIECNDNRGPGNVAPAAVVTWTFTYLDRETSGTACNVNERYNMSMHPDVAEMKAKSAAAAYDSLWSRPGFENLTGEAVLTFSWTRGQTQGLPIPQQGTSFTAVLAIAAEQWDASITEKPAEVGK